MKTKYLNFLAYWNEDLKITPKYLFKTDFIEFLNEQKRPSY